jgi:hypothetical protein
MRKKESEKMRKKPAIFNIQYSIFNHIILIAIVLFVAGCGFFRSPEKERCRRILPKEKVTDILTDIYLMEGFLSDQQVRNQETRDSVDYYFAGIFDTHGVSFEKFKQALDCYLLYSNDMETIHEEILNRLSLKLTEADAELERYMQRQQEELEKADSLRSDSLEMDFMRR